MGLIETPWGRMADEGHLGGFVLADEARPHGDRGTYEERLWRYGFPLFRVRSIADIGCGQGHSLAWFAAHGYQCVGIDGSELAATTNMRPDLFLSHDLTTGPWTPGAPYDAVWCIEVAEHIEEQFSGNLIQTFVNTGARLIFMTHALPGQEGFHHVNCQPPAYWIAKMEAGGFRLSHARTKIAKRLAKGFFRRNGLVFKRA